MKRRGFQILVATGMVSLGGCISGVFGGQAVGRLTAYTLAEPPSDVTPAQYPKEEYENQYLTTVIDKAIEKSPSPSDKGNSVAIEIPKRDWNDVTSAMEKIPPSAALDPSGDNPIAGTFVKHDQRTVVFALEKYL